MHNACTPTLGYLVSRGRHYSNTFRNTPSIREHCTYGTYSCKPYLNTRFIAYYSLNTTKSNRLGFITFLIFFLLEKTSSISRFEYYKPFSLGRVYSIRTPLYTTAFHVRNRRDPIERKTTSRDDARF